MDMTENLFQFLNTASNFSRTEFERIMPYFESRALKKGEIWIEQNSICREMAYIDKGLLKITYANPDGHEITSCFCSSNSMASSFKSFISQTPSELQLKAIENSLLLYTSFEDLQKLRIAIPAWESFERKILEKEYLSLWNYAHSLNAEQANARYSRLLKDQPEVVQKASVQDMASYLGVTRETLSRIRKKAH